ncbi:MAG: hypothetical protein IPJ74_11715 [Saprospiraceae bacterium]|nr:hypothetical protein [Saprospiraceae bacterium]
MRVVLEIKRLQDLEILLPLFKRLNIRVKSVPENLSVMTEPAIKKEKPPLSKHIGTLPNSDVEAFEKYLKETREEWERNIF